MLIASTTERRFFFKSAALKLSLLNGMCMIFCLFVWNLILFFLNLLIVVVMLVVIVFVFGFGMRFFGSS